MNQIFKLIEYECIPYVIFDGGNLPSKDAEEFKRKEKREISMNNAKSIYRWVI